MKKLSLLLLLSLCACQHRLCPPIAGEPARTQVFIFGGQSNMTGFPPYGTQVSSDARIQYLNDPMNGPAVSFLHAYEGVHPKRTVASKQFGVGGTSIAQWSPLGNQAIYAGMVLEIQQLAKDPHYEIAGFIFYQGECDASPYCKPYRTAEWAESFKAMVTGIRSAAGNPTLPVVFAQIATTSGAYDFYWADIQAQQSSVVMPNVSMITTSDMARRDAAHLTDASYDVVGKRFESAYEQMVNPGCTGDDGWWIHF